MASPVPDDGEESVSAQDAETLDEFVEVESPKRRPKKRDGSSLRKAPQAPKRFKSSYICFFMAKQPEIKDSLGDKATVTEISKRSAEMWRNLSAGERAHWEDVAAKDKKRYMVEKATYTYVSHICRMVEDVIGLRSYIFSCDEYAPSTLIYQSGPWQVPWKRVKKDPSAPKRPMSAFLYYSQEKRHEVKESFPDMKNTEVSRMLGEMWRNAPEEERKPHIDREKVEREKYKVEIASWRKEYEAKVESQRRLQPEQPQFLPVSCGGDQSSVRMPPTPLAGMPYDPSVAAAPMPPIPQQPFMGHGGYGYPGFYPYGLPPHVHPPVSTRQHVILGPNGRPYYSNSYTTGPPIQLSPTLPEPQAFVAPEQYQPLPKPVASPTQCDDYNPDQYEQEPQILE